MKDSSKWQRGVAFVRGTSIYKTRRISQKEMLNLCKSIEDENLLAKIDSKISKNA